MPHDQLVSRHPDTAPPDSEMSMIASRLGVLEVAALSVGIASLCDGKAPLPRRPADTATPEGRTPGLLHSIRATMASIQRTSPRL